MTNESDDTVTPNQDAEPCELVAIMFPELSPKWRKKITDIAGYLIVTKTHGELALLASYAVDRMTESKKSALGLYELLAQQQESLPKATRSALAKHAAAAKLQNDPKQKAKLEAHKLWQDWQARPTLYKSGAAFQRDVVAKLPLIESTKTVERWCRGWSDK